MRLSKKLEKLTPSPTLALNSKAQELKASGANVLNFAVGEPDFPTHPGIVEKAIEALQKGMTRYGPAGGGVPFRQAICRKLKRENNLDYTPTEIVCGMGAKELLFHIFLTLLDEGDEVILNAPAWVSYKEQVLAAGGTPVMIPMPENLNGPMVEPSIIEKYASSKTKAFVLCSPNNPAGYALDKQALTELGHYLKTKHWWIVSDEIYEYLSFDHPHVSLLEVQPALKDRYIHVNGMSKGYAMTGWRVGYAAGPASMIKEVRSFQSHSSTCLPPFIEAAATWAIDQGKNLMREQMDDLKARRDFAVNCARQIKNVDFVAPQGAFYLYLDIRRILKDSKTFKDNDSMAFSDMFLTKHHVAVVPGEAFDSPGFL